ncbi:MON2 [Candida margitis]|uniref:MON2 n=1 Tax=Candida margitis TaxID=1775924 RepID=UPI0022273779|nr:MON2 [Candida margitis]KAI5967658.1 MON2 [Candida margitis]
MNNVQSLQTDLAHLSSDSKKRYPDVRQLVDSVIKTLKALNPKTPLKDITDDSLRLQTINALILACDSGNLKLNNSSIAIIQKLIQAHFIPSEKLKDVMRAFSEASHLAEGVQVRILQCLQQFTQEYKTEITGDILLDMVSLCSGLTTTNKTSNVSGVASATLEQVVSNVFDNISVTPSSGYKEIKVENDEVIKVDSTSYEGFCVFEDLNCLTTNKKPQFLKGTIRSQSALDIIENVILHHDELFQQHKELAYLLRAQTVPSLLKILNSPSRSYQLTQRAIRVIQVLLTTQLESLEIEVELILSYLNHSLLENDSHQDGSVPQWEKILILEMLKNIFSKFDIIKAIYEKYDHDESKKDALKELFTVFDSYLQDDNQFSNDTFGRPESEDYTASSGSTPSHRSTLSKENFKTSLLDHLDKIEPQTNISSSYPVYLIFEILVCYCNGVSHFVTTMSDNTSDEQELEKNVDFINAILASTATEVSLLFKRFMYSALDDELFRTLLISFQNFAHSVGLLGLNSIRNNLLLRLSKAAISLTVAPNKEDGDAFSIYEDQKKHLLAIGGSLAESLTSSKMSFKEDSNGNGPVSHSSVKARYFSSRNMLCLKTLMYLAISLGSTLAESWSIIWITLQWCAYYFEGPDEYSNSSRSKQNHELANAPQLKISEEDAGSIYALLKSLFDNISGYESESFKQLLSCLAELNETAFSEDGEKVVNFDLTESPHNKTYFLRKFFQVCELAPGKFLVEDASIWEFATSYITKFGSRRTLHPNLRLYVTESFSTTIEALASEGFHDDSMAKDTAARTLDGLNKYIRPLFKQGPPKELLTLNCETEIHLSVLTELHSLIDNYDTHYQGSWAKVFEILNTPFKTIDSNNDQNLKEKLQLLVEKSFDTLKLILDEFLSSLPFKQFKILVDTLVNFAYQSYDLNISFSSVSYFWLISDSLKSRLSQFVGNKNPTLEIKSEDELIDYININDESYESYICLEVYLLFCLAKLSKQEISRAQVRDGAIQTFFQIVDVHGPALESSWNVVHLLVLPCLFDIEAFENPKESLETIRLLLEGFTNMYRKFFGNSNTSDFNGKWQMLFDYMEKLLTRKNIEVNVIVFKSFQDLIDPSAEINTEPIRNSLFDLWQGYSIEYDLVNSSYQDSLVQYMHCFPSLYRVIESDLTLDEVNTIVDIFNKGARYPVLPLHQSDENKPSKLQSSILTNISLLTKKNFEIQAAVVQLLTNIIVYPYGVRMRIEQKLQNNMFVQKNYRIPTFVGISHLGLQLMDKRFKEFGYTRVFSDDQSIIKTIKALIEVVERKLRGVSTVKTPLWIDAHNILKELIDKLINKRKEDISDELWSLLTKSLMLTIAFDSDIASDADIKISQYQELSAIIIPQLVENDNQLILDLVKSVYDNSYLYNLNSDEKELVLNNVTDDKQAIDNLTLFNFDEYFGTTEPLHVFFNKKIRFNCLNELFRLSKLDTKYRSSCEIYLLRRISFTLRRAVADLRLYGDKPLPQVQQDEVLLILEQMHQLQQVSADNEQEFKKLNRLLILLTPFAHKFGEGSLLLPSVLIKRL